MSCRGTKGIFVGDVNVIQPGHFHKPGNMGWLFSNHRFCMRKLFVGLICDVLFLVKSTNGILDVEYIEGQTQVKHDLGLLARQQEWQHYYRLALYQSFKNCDEHNNVYLSLLLATVTQYRSTLNIFR